MQPRRFKHLRLEDPPRERIGARIYPSIFRATLAVGMLVAVGLFLAPAGRVDLALGVLLVLAAATACMDLAQHLPVQNVLGAAAIAAGLGSGAHIMGSLTGVPFGPYVYTRDMGRPLFGVLPWAIPFLWVSFLFTSRGTARLILRPWRHTRNYGFVLIGVTCALTVLLALGLELFFTRVFSYWEWSETKLRLNLLGSPVINLLGWGMVSLLILAFATPFLIRKKPGTPPPPDLHPLLLWLMIDTLFIAGAFSRNLSVPAVTLAIMGLMVAALALLGGRSSLRNHEHIRTR